MVISNYDNGLKIINEMWERKKNGIDKWMKENKENDLNVISWWREIRMVCMKEQMIKCVNVWIIEWINE